ncbi:hypothetical protein [Streptomyces sp. MT206]|uniref:hypothetical protein n=1 Tax=Streptomyces sp. MT206 TaxID=3031407 RepID=UPI002FC93350
MTPRLTAGRLTAVRDAAVRTSGTLHPMLASAADTKALEALGLAGFLAECGHLPGSPDPENLHRSHHHLLRLTDAGRAKAEQAGGPQPAQRGGRPLAPLAGRTRD